MLRLVLSMVWGRRLDPDNIGRLIEDAIATIAEFGEPGDDVQTLTDGPLTDPDARRSFADSGVKRTARRLARQSPFYGRRFAAADVDPARLRASPDFVGRRRPETAVAPATAPAPVLEPVTTP